MKKYILLFLFIFITILNSFPIQAVSTNKRQIPFEITNIDFNENYLTISGWGFFVESHHFDSSKSHSYELILTSQNSELHYSAVPIYHSQTETMRKFGTRKCNQNEYYKNGGICYYNYDYTGFEFHVPYNDLKIDENYEAKLTIHSNILPMNKSTYLFYPSLMEEKIKKGKIEYRINTDLYETQLKVVDFGVFDRIQPSKNSKIHQSSKMCNFTYKYNRYFDENSIYKHVYERVFNESTTFYRVKSDVVTTCKDGRNVTKEGNDNDSWIASNWVDFNGIPLTISVIDTNQPPNIHIIQHPTILMNEIKHFDFKNYIEAFDPEEGDLTNKVQVMNSVNMNNIGKYEFHLKVSDSEGKTDEKILYVTVVKNNHPPVIFAENVTIYQYEDFDYLKNVSSFDEEDGDLTSKLTYRGVVDTNTLETYFVTYSSIDSDHEETNKTIEVHVIVNPKLRIRFISNHSSRIFYKESIPMNWITKESYLKEQLQNPKKFAHFHLSK